MLLSQRNEKFGIVVCIKYLCQQNDQYNEYSQLSYNGLSYQLPAPVRLGLIESTTVRFDNPVTSQSDKQFIEPLDNTCSYVHGEDNLKGVGCFIDKNVG